MMSTSNEQITIKYSEITDSKEPDILGILTDDPSGYIDSEDITYYVLTTETLDFLGGELPETYYVEEIPTPEGLAIGYGLVPGPHPFVDLKNIGPQSFTSDEGPPRATLSFNTNANGKSEAVLTYEWGCNYIEPITRRFIECRP